MIRSAITTAASATVALALIDPCRIAMQALVLRKLRERNPELFDSKLAAEAVRLSILETE